MLSTQAPAPIAARLKEQTRIFLDAFKHSAYDRVWNDLITPEAASLLSATAWPCYAHKNNKVDALLITKIDQFPEVPIHRGLALAFQIDLEEQRTGFFSGIADGFEKMGWYDFSSDDHIAFLEGDGAVFVASTPNVKLLMPFIAVTSGEYNIDFECLQVFSMSITASSLSDIAKRCLALNLRTESLAYFELAAALLPVCQRARQLLAEHPVVRQFVTAQRRADLVSQAEYALSARDKTRRLFPGGAASNMVEADAGVARFDTKLDHTVAAAVAVGTSPQAQGTLNMSGMSVHAETVIFAGASTHGQAATALVPIQSSRPTPNFPDDHTRILSEQLASAKIRRLRLQEHGRDTTDIEREILDLKRRLREGGQLRAGDSLGKNDRYDLLDILGRGGFASVWLAYDNERHSEVAIKVLHSNLAGDRVRLDRFKRGARIMNELHHEAVVRVLETYGEDGGWHYFVMEYLPGGDFRRATLELRLKQADVLPLMLRVCEAAALAHSQRIIHRDIKPANIVIDERGQPKLTDFDLVAAPDTTGGTRTGAVGTVVYTAPEILDGSMESSAASDVYSLAMTTLFGLYGNDLPMDVLRSPETAFELLYVAEPVKAEILRALDWDPWQRHPDAGKLGEALAVAMSVSGGAAMVARRDENQYSADEPIHSPLIPGLQRVVDPPPGLSIDVEYKRYYNSRFGFSVDVPTFFVPQPGPVNGDGRRFAYRKVVELVTSGIYNWDENNTVQAFFEEAMARAIAQKGALIPEGTVEGNSSTMKNRLGNTITYQKSTLANGVISGVSFSYPAAQDAYFDPIARRVLTSFRAPTRPDPRRE